MSESTDLVVHPLTGEVFETLQTISTDRLAETTLALKEAETRLKMMRRDVDDELRQRFLDKLTERGIDVPSNKHFVEAGDYEIRVEGGNESVWDADELEPVLRELIDDGTISAHEVTDVIRHETSVSRSNANRLLDRLGGEAHAAVARCRTWRRKGPGYVRVDRTTFPHELSDH